MTRELFVHLLPGFIKPQQLRDSVAVVIDLLRASTTITTALEAGAKGVLPCIDVAAARERARDYPPEEILLGGEREGKLIDGFDLDNSPAAYSSGRVAGKTVIFTTTNGTAAIERASSADRVLIGCFLHLNALIDLLVRDGRSIHVICAGTNGAVSLEDVLCAGAIAAGVWPQGESPDIVDDSAFLAKSLYESATEDRETYRHTLRQSQGGRNLCRIGMEADIEIASQWDTVRLVPEYYQSDRIIRPAVDVPEMVEQRLRAPE